MKQRTAKSSAEVRCWIETTPHHQAQVEGADYAKGTSPTHMVLNNHHQRLRVPWQVWADCFVKAGSPFDARMYRWDHEAESAALGMKT